MIGLRIGRMMVVVIVVVVVIVAMVVVMVVAVGMLVIMDRICRQSAKTGAEGLT